MKKTLGIFLIMIGAGMLSFNGCNHQSGKVMTANGMIHDAPKHAESFNWVPYFGTLVFLTGVIVTTRRK